VSRQTINKEKKKKLKVEKKGSRNGKKKEVKTRKVTLTGGRKS